MKFHDDRSQRLILAANTRRSIRHPHLAPVRVERDDHGRVRILLQRDPAPTLSDVLASGPLDLRSSLRLLYGVAAAVDALRGAGLVARDLKPDRILVCPRRRAVLADPGIPLDLVPRRARAEDPDSAYRSPEELAGHPIDARSNVYSLGAILLATLTAPDGERLVLPSAAEAVIDRAMAVQPERRYAKPPEFIVAVALATGLARRRRPARTTDHGPAQPDPPETQSPALRQRPATNGRSADRRVAPRPRPAPARAEPQPAPAQTERKAAPVRPPRSEAAPTAKPRPERSERSTGSESGPLRPRLRVPAMSRESVPVLPRLRALRPPKLPATGMRRLSAPAFPRLRPPDPGRLRAPVRISAAAIPLALAVVGFFLVGILLARTANEEPQPALIERSSFAVELPGGWGETKVAQAGGIELTAPLAAAPLGEGRTGLVVARVPDMVTLDRRFLTEAGAEGRRTEVRLGRLEAWRYTGLPAKRGVVASAYLAPTTGDPLLFICHAPRSDARARLAECEDIASTVALRGERPASLAVMARHREQRVSVMARLRRERLRGRRRLAGVELAAEQAQAARELDRAYKDAAARLAQGEPPAGTTDLDDLVGSLQLTASAYGRLADAAADADEARYRAASEAVLEGEQAVRRDAADSEPPDRRDAAA